MTRIGRGGRVTGWDAPVGVPEDLQALRGPTGGIRRLPLRIYSGGGPAEVFNLDDPRQRVRFYEIVLSGCCPARTIRPGLYPCLAEWRWRAERRWQEHRSSDLTLADQPDYRRRLTAQLPRRAASRSV